MNSRTRINKWCSFPVATSLPLLIAGAMLSPLQAGQPDVMVPMQTVEHQWKWGISFDYLYRDIDRNENYLSPPELWNVDYDGFTGDLWGFSVFVEPPCFMNATIDFSYHTGDMDGTFRNYSLDPDPFDDGVYTGLASFDRDEYELGMTIPFQSVGWLFGRIEGFYYTEDGTWDYGGGFFEPQEYDMWGVTVGLGAGESFPLGSGGITLDLAIFLGLVYFDMEHKEVLSGAVTSWSDWGFKGSADARLNFPINQSVAIYTGVGYEYILTDSGSLDQTLQGFLASLGISGEF